MTTMAFQITDVSIVCWTACSGGDQRKDKNFPSLAFVRGIHWWPMTFPLICAWTNDWAHNRDAVDLRRHGAFYDVTVLCLMVVLCVYNWAYHWNAALYFRYRWVCNRQRWLWAALWQQTRGIHMYMPQSWFHHWWWWPDSMCSWVRSTTGHRIIIYIVYMQWVVVITRFPPNHQNRHPIARPWGRDKGSLLWVWTSIYILLQSLPCLIFKMRVGWWGWFGGWVGWG